MLLLSCSRTRISLSCHLFLLGRAVLPHNSLSHFAAIPMRRHSELLGLSTVLVVLAMATVAVLVLSPPASAAAARHDPPPTPTASTLLSNEGDDADDDFDLGSLGDDDDNDASGDVDDDDLDVDASVAGAVATAATDEADSGDATLASLQVLYRLSHSLTFYRCSSFFRHFDVLVCSVQKQLNDIMSDSSADDDADASEDSLVASAGKGVFVRHLCGFFALSYVRLKQTRILTLCLYLMIGSNGFAGTVGDVDGDDDDLDGLGGNDDVYPQAKPVATKKNTAAAVATRDDLTGVQADGDAGLDDDADDDAEDGEDEDEHEAGSDALSPADPDGMRVRCFPSFGSVCRAKNDCLFTAGILEDYKEIVSLMQSNDEEDGSAETAGDDLSDAEGEEEEADEHVKPTQDADHVNDLDYLHASDMLEAYLDQHGLCLYA